MKINSNYLNLKDSYLFSTIAKKVNAYAEKYPDKKIIRLGIGDVTLPISQCAVAAMQQAAAEMGVKETFKGYGPEQGYGFLKEALQGYYLKNGVSLEINEIFVSDGAKSDIGNILDIFSKDNKVLIPNPVYPVYEDTNIMDGREILYIAATEENGFLPLPDENIKADIVYLCSPNNPTGAAYTKEQLQKWVDFANDNGMVILFDAAYETFITESNVPRSIFEIEGAKTCAIEFCSLSKTAGFTGVRCGYTVVPNELQFDGVKLNKLWNRRQTTKFNGVSYIVQKGAAAVFTPAGQAEIKKNVAYYQENAQIIAQGLKEMGVWFTGAKNSPYVFLKCFDKTVSWEFFDYLLNEINVVGTPGSGFGTGGEGFFRLTGFGGRENTIEAMKRIKSLKK